MGMLKKVGAVIGNVASKAVAKIKRNKLMVAALCFGLLSASAMAQEGTGVTTVEIVKKETGGGISFDPSALFSPLVDAITSAYSKWAVVVLIIAVVGFIVYIFKKK